MLLKIWTSTPKQNFKNSIKNQIHQARVIQENPFSQFMIKTRDFLRIQNFKVFVNGTIFTKTIKKFDATEGNWTPPEAFLKDGSFSNLIWLFLVLLNSLRYSKTLFKLLSQCMPCSDFTTNLSISFKCSS